MLSSSAEEGLAPVDLLRCSFMHCPSPSSSVDTLTSRHVISTSTPPIAPPSQYSLGHRGSIPDLGVSPDSRDESFHNLRTDANTHMVPQGEMMMSSMSMSGSRQTTITPSQHQTMVDTLNII